jgi:proteasome lid subunit RPN8/RPN11
MSYVTIAKPVNERILYTARSSKNEIVGFLLGKLEGKTIVIEGSVTGESSAQPYWVSLSSNAIAEIADRLVTGLLKGKIVGWYHSHPLGGLFFSETDVQTQRVLQQFSRLIVGMVVDGLTAEVGFFRVESQRGLVVRIPAERITVGLKTANKPRRQPSKSSMLPPSSEQEDSLSTSAKMEDQHEWR